MMRLRYGRGEVGVPPLQARDAAEAVAIAPAATASTPLAAEEVARRLEEAGLASAIRSSSRLALIVNDQTRKAGMLSVLEAVASFLPRAPAHAPSMVIAYGLHARQPDEVSRRIYGDAILERVAIRHHDARDPSGLKLVGELPDGQPLSVAREVADADLRLLVGGVGFHYYAGFSGGRKAVLPGVADEASIVRNHLRVLDPGGVGGRAAGCAPGRLDGNPVSDEMFAAARLLDRTGASFLVNAVTATTGAVVDLACGAPTEGVFRLACSRLLTTHTAPIAAERPVDALIASAGGWPYDASLYQAHKAYDNAFRALQPAIEQGDRPVLVFVAKCDEGYGHPRFRSWLDHSTRENHYRALRAGYEIVGQTSLAVRDKAAQTRTIAVTDLDAPTCALLGWERATSVKEAVSMAGLPRRWGVMPAAAQVLPRVA